jgi:outer membrane protein OmpA-like peptidoglycan-associated protein
MLALVALGLAPVGARAQTGDDQWARWWYGGFLGGNINLFSGQLHDLNADGINDAGIALPSGFDKGTGVGLTLGGIVEYNSGKLLGGNLMIGYDNRSVTFTTKNPSDQLSIGRRDEDLTTSFAYVSIEPNLRINLGSRMLHLMLGPSFMINVAKGYSYTFTDPVKAPETHDADLQDARSFVIGGQAGVGYDIPLTDVSASTQMLLTPFAQFHLSQPVIDPRAGSPNEFKLSTIRVGVELKFGARPIASAPSDVTAPAADFSVRVPSVITESRRLNETFPLRNYIFFDQGSTAIPDRYRKLSGGEATSFREEQLLKPEGAGTGNESNEQLRSRRQMEVYYQVMNVFADRLRRNASASLQLVGSANGNANAGKEMAENVKNYLVQTFGIDAERIKTRGEPMPLHRSGSGAAQGEDKKMVDAENSRVEIIGAPPELMQPVNIVSVQDEPIDNDVVLTLPSRENIDQWNVQITDNSGMVQNYGPYRYSSVARIDSKALLGSRNEGRFTAKIDAKLKNGETMSFGEKEFRLVRADKDEEQTGTRYSILFEFDESKTVQTYETFLTETVAPNIPNGSSVIIHGHTDVIGDPDYNQKLSQRRSDEAQKILTAALAKAGKTVTFDTYGFGEDDARSPFNNTLPEQRYYNRTVVVEIVPKQ